LPQKQTQDFVSSICSQ